MTSLAVDMCMQPHKPPAQLHLRAWISDLRALGACTKVTEGIVDTSCLMQPLAGSSYTKKEQQKQKHALISMAVLQA